jgi:Flp pilus assembly protein TadD
MYKKCINDHPNCWRAYQNLGVAYIMAKDFEGANTVLKTYVSHVPRDPYGHDSLGVSYS